MPMAQRDLADLYASAGKNDLAEAAYRPLVAAQPNDPELHRALGRALLLQKKFPEAQQELLIAVRMKRDSPDAYVDLAFAASENKNYDLRFARSMGAPHVRQARFMPTICFFLRASAYDHLGDWKQASADYHHFLDTAKGKYPDQEWQARHRLVAIEHHRSTEHAPSCSPCMSALWLWLPPRCAASAGERDALKARLPSASTEDRAEI